MNIDKNQLLSVAKKAAYAAAKVHCRYFNEEGLVVEEKSDQSYNKVTQADLEAEQAIVEVIHTHYPSHNVFAEENKYAQTSSAYQWIVDPLDGTNNFAAGIPLFCVSIAVVYEGEVVVGVVYEPVREELFSAVKSEGAFLNDKSIYVSRARDVKEAILITGFYYDRGEAMRTNLKKVENFFEQNVVGIRRLGSAALDLCYVAAGRAGGFWEFKLHPWDFAAGMLIVQEAGGKVTNREGAPLMLLEDNYVVSSNGLIHDQMLNTLQSS